MNLKLKIGMCMTALAMASVHIYADNPPENTPEEKHCTLLVKTNTLHDLALMPDIGLEAGLGNGWSIGGNMMYGWWTDRSRFYWRACSADAGIRKYFGTRTENSGDRLCGHHAGIYAGIVTYDFELGGRGVISDWREEWDRYFGIDYGYSMPVADHLNIDFTLGLGYVGGRYKEYLPDLWKSPDNWHYVWQSTNNLHYFGPTRLEVSLVWELDLKHNKKSSHENE